MRLPWPHCAFRRRALLTTPLSPMRSSRKNEKQGGEIRFSSEVTKLRHAGVWSIRTSSGDCEADFIINCAGLHSDRISQKSGARDPTKIVPFRGEYYELKPSVRTWCVTSSIPCRTLRFPS